MPKIGLDYGHGGKDGGASVSSYTEKDIVLAIGKRVTYHLRRHNQTVVESRNSDVFVGLHERSDLFNREKVDIVVSIHVNSFTDSNAQGFEVYKYREGVRNNLLSNSIHDEVIKASLYTIDRGVKIKDLHMLRETYAISCLVETAFISNEEDRQLLLRNIEGFAIAITKGILKYFETQYIEEVAETDKMYRVQVGAFTQRVNAERLAAELKARGYNVQIV